MGQGNSEDTILHHQGRYLALAETHDWEYVTRTNCSGVTVLVALTPDRELLLVEQFRIPVGATVMELPAGLAGDGHHRGEDLASAARRELEEETGYRASEVTELLSCPSSAGMSDEVITIFLAQGLMRVGEGGGDASEDITVHCVPLDNANQWLADRARSGQLLDPKIYAALYWLTTPAAAGLIGSATRGS